MYIYIYKTPHWTPACQARHPLFSVDLNHRRWQPITGQQIHAPGTNMAATEFELGARSDACRPGDSGRWKGGEGGVLYLPVCWESGRERSLWTGQFFHGTKKKKARMLIWELFVIVSLWRTIFASCRCSVSPSRLFSLLVPCFASVLELGCCCWVFWGGVCCFCCLLLFFPEKCCFGVPHKKEVNRIKYVFYQK